jgi:hypothetical protein
MTVAGDVGTPVYMPPDRDFDARSDVYLLGNVLLELLTFDPRGDVEARDNCPSAWAELVADSMSRLKGKRPQTAHEFLVRLEDGTGGVAPPLALSKPPAAALATDACWQGTRPEPRTAPPKPAPTGPSTPPLDHIRALIDAERYEEAMHEYSRSPCERQLPGLLKDLQADGRPAPMPWPATRPRPSTTTPPPWD